MNNELFGVNDAEPASYRGRKLKSSPRQPISRKETKLVASAPIDKTYVVESFDKVFYH